MRRSLHILLIGAVAAGGLLVSGPAHATTTPKAPIGGGYVASPKSVRSASATVVVPNLSCAKTAEYSIAIGLFGFVTQAKTQSRWSVAVVATCTKGKTRYRAGDGSTFDHVGGALVVHPGDRVTLAQRSATEFAVGDQTTGEGAGGSSSTTGPSPVLRTNLLIGVRVSGKVPAGRTIAVSSAKVNGSAINSTTHSAQTQKSYAGSVAARPASLRTGGAFAVAVPKR